MSRSTKIEKIKQLSKEIYNEKDYKLIDNFISDRQFEYIIELNEAEIKKEYRKCIPDAMTDRYCKLMSLQVELLPYDMRDLYPGDIYCYEDDNDF